ncbi:MAG: hypothetical protein BGP16_05440 [Sphingobium sp. 66-54]|nr:MAG: hypothetical protein BGP16_05440 [Sphingobium sp. 66-54]
MTKPREPFSIDAALERIAGVVPGGWAAMAAEVGREERTVRKWGDEDDPAEINLSASIALDALFQKHGGTGRPLYDIYDLKTGVAMASGIPDQFELLRRLARVAKEAGEANTALVRFALPDATEADRRVAQREVIEAFTEFRNILPLLEHVGRSPGAESRAPP